MRHSAEIAGWLAFLVPIGVRIDSYSFHNTAAKLEAPVQTLIA